MWIKPIGRDLISSRTKEGLRSAKSRGRSGGRPSKRNKSDTVMALYNSGVPIKKIVADFSLSRATIHRIIKDNNEKVCSILQIISRCGCSI